MWIIGSISMLYDLYNTDINDFMTIIRLLYDGAVV